MKHKILMTILLAAFIPAGTARANSGPDFNADGQADILWRNQVNGKNIIWKSAKATKKQPVTRLEDLNWVVAGTGDFNGGGVSDILWRNTSTYENMIWLSANSTTVQAVTTLAANEWVVAGIANFNGDDKDDILWRNTTSGANVIWLSADSSTTQAVTQRAGNEWNIVGTGDYNGDSQPDILWRNTNTGANEIWLSANSGNVQTVTAQADQEWQVAASADFNGDGDDDILWHNNATGESVIWLSGNSTTSQNVAAQIDPNWRVAAAADYDGDSKADIFWRNRLSGKNVIWLSGDSALLAKVAARSAKNWQATDVRKVHMRTNEGLSCTVNTYCDINLVAYTWGGFPPYYYQHDTFRNGTPPPGTVIDLNGHLKGTPTRTGTYKFGICAVDLVGNFDCKLASVIIRAVKLVKIKINTDIKPANSMVVTFDGKVIRDTSSTQAMQATVISTTVGAHTMTYTPTDTNYYCSTFFTDWLPSQYKAVTPNDVCYGLDIVWQPGVPQSWVVTVLP